MIERNMWRGGANSMSEEEGFILAFLGIFLAFFAVFAIVGLIFYILQAIGLFKIAKNEGRGDLAWLAWIPVASTFLLTLIVEKDVHKEFRGKMTLIYGIALVASMILANFFALIGFIPLVVMYYAFFFLAKKFSPNPVLHIVIAVITFGMAIPIQIFIFRNRESIAPADPGAIVDGTDV